MAGNEQEHTRPPSQSGDPGHSRQDSLSADILSLNTLPIQDLSGDKLLRSAPRSKIGAHTVPRLGKIVLLSKLGQGAMGAVYYGIHPLLRIPVAVKVLPYFLAEQDPVLIERFYREAQTAARVRSRHLVHVSDVGEEQGLVFIVMEYVTGISVAQYIKELKAKGRPGASEADALDIVLAASKGLAAAHAEGVVHRDVKPGNIMLPLGKSGQGCDVDMAMLADLGLARNESESRSLTGNFQAIGTPGYMAPEQIEDAKNVQKPADVFSMGATLYALLSGHAPFTGTAPLSIMHATTVAPHQPVCELRLDVSRQTSALLDRCLAKNPAQRYADAEALIEGLRECKKAERGGQHDWQAGTRILRPSKSASESDQVLPRVREKEEVLPDVPAAARTTLTNAVAAASGTDAATVHSPSVPPPLPKPAPPLAAPPPPVPLHQPLPVSGARTAGDGQSRSGAGSQANPHLALPYKIYEQWPFEGIEAERRQKETAAILKAPVVVRVPLPGGVPLELVLIPAGEFSMGSPDDEAGRDPDEVQHFVRLTRPFYIGRFPVTQAQWQAVTGANPSRFKDGPNSSRRPAERVSWDDIRHAFIPAIQPLAPAGWTFRLPSEAQWEYACRAGKQTPFYPGDTLGRTQALFKLDGSEAATVNANSLFSPSMAGQIDRTQTGPVGSFTPNCWGLHETHGNVWEWCEDWYDPLFYKNVPAVDPLNEKPGEYRVLRGGAWNYTRDHCRSARRYRSASNSRAFNFGFRLVLG